VTDAPQVGVGSRVAGSCPSCSLPVMTGQQYCSACGASLDAPTVAPEVRSELAGVPPGDADYPSEYKLAAGLVTVIAPFVSLVAALIMRGSQSNPVRRATATHLGCRLRRMASGGAAHCAHCCRVRG
jgi:hypothetical protein